MRHHALILSISLTAGKVHELARALRLFGKICTANCQTDRQKKANATETLQTFLYEKHTCTVHRRWAEMWSTKWSAGRHVPVPYPLPIALVCGQMNAAETKPLFAAAELPAGEGEIPKPRIQKRCLLNF